MALKRYLNSRTTIATAATALMLSLRARRAGRRGLASLGSAMIEAGSTVARGTRNLREAEKHVTKFGGKDS
jgi:hypothetical protein